MHWSLKVPEIVRPICRELDTESALAMALTCHVFLEPGLDSVWHTLTSFSPFISCVPEQLWRVQWVQSSGLEDGPRMLKVLHLNRPLCPEDLERYRTFYAHRIKVFNLKYISVAARKYPMFSIEACLALQSAIGAERGALAPRLNAFYWPPLDTLAKWFPSIHALALHFPIVSLFLPTTTLFVDLTASPRGEVNPLNSTAIAHALRPLTKLKKLQMPYSTPDADYLCDAIMCSAWGSLEDLTMSNLTMQGLVQLALLPRLVHLEVTFSYEDEIGKILYQPSTTPSDPLFPSHFPSLRKLRAVGRSLAILNLLSMFPTSHGLEELRTETTGGFEPAVEMDSLQAAINLIRQRFNPGSLRSFMWNEAGGVGWGDDDDDQVDAGTDVARPTVDISPLYLFPNLQKVQISCDIPFQFGPSDAQRIPMVWPNISFLWLHYYEAIRYFPPLMDHNHYLSMLDDLPNATAVSLTFDVSRVTGLERAANGPFTLDVIWFDKTLPLYSSSALLTFLKNNFTKKTKLMLVGGGHPCEECGLDVVRRRWKAVREGWINHCGSPLAIIGSG